MFTIGLVAFRETFEMVLILVPLLAYITRLDRKDLSKYIYSGSILGLITSILCGGALIAGARNLKGFPEDIFEGSMSLFLCGLIIYSVLWLSKQNSNTSASVENKYKFETTGLSLFLLALLSVFRECLELILFTLPQHEVGIINIVISILVGLLITATISLIIYKSSIKLNINIVFSLITLVLIYIGSTMFGEALLSLFPNSTDSLETAGKMIFGIPMLYLFLKSEIKRYIKKK